jgi:hypothetical protein
MVVTWIYRQDVVFLTSWLIAGLMVMAYRFATQSVNGKQDAGLSPKTL